MCIRDRLLPFFLFPVCVIRLAGLPLGYLLKRTLWLLPVAVMIGLFNPLVDRTPMGEWQEPRNFLRRPGKNADLIDEESSDFNAGVQTVDAGISAGKPDVYKRQPLRWSSSVDFPAPFPPTTATDSPWVMRRETPFSAGGESG